MARLSRSRTERPAVRLIDTDFSLARQVGAIRIVDAHVVAVYLPYGAGLVVTGDSVRLSP